MAPRAIAALRDRGSGARKEGAVAAQCRRSPRAIAALRDRSSGARKEGAAAAQDRPRIEKSFID
ncbi:hypothetical protein [Paenibacillus odorifer]|uniref:hypothetical protein n=1 Tax=Paenibacillus odorifer TaxID=189426 RepID=UPI001180FD81|nr:hypothetical protein [Paenibacillus odorifer]